MNPKQIDELIAHYGASVKEWQANVQKAKRAFMKSKADKKEDARKNLKYSLELLNSAKICYWEYVKMKKEA